ncbi:TIGR02679 family protein [Alkaliphilus serpentinus]|uniref:TIGR02679 family protein n=1 Tax=Alkaliphilus serpentinus TaxID=1482731 RepID=A0A833M9Z6_9FIRM|nr:TIGR02679 family protein [Alkaliphilus serpentinus]KAB3529803.1 TIGR02679 family protein [Alkaliphilus serpentinus]
MEMKILLNQCVDYFKSNIGYRRLFYKIRDKYYSLGSMGGTVVLTNLANEEKEALSSLLRKDFRKQKSASIKVESIQKALSGTKFEELKLQDIIEAYFNEELIYKKDQFNSYKQEREKFFADLIDNVQYSDFAKWLNKQLAEKKNGYRILISRYDSDKSKLKKDLLILAEAIRALPVFTNNKQRLAFFSSSISKNPHTFDDGTDCNKLLTYTLADILKSKLPNNAEEKAELFYEAGIIKDDISNFTTLNGLIAFTDSNIHKGWEAFYQRGEPMQINLWNLSEVQKIISPSGKVFVVENPTVFSGILDELKDCRPPIICTYGQIKLASLMLLDILVESNTEIYYSGDFDPEGLLIADKLKNRFTNNLHLWNYSQEDYIGSLSNHEINQNRLNKMKKLKDNQLQNIAHKIQKIRRAGYQELLIHKLKRDIMVHLIK